MSLDDSATIVTGASSGIGEATAHEFASRGARVALAARSEDRLTSIAADLETEYGAETLVVPTDVRDEAAVEDLVDTVAAEWDGLDVLVNNAGLGRGGDVADLSTEDYRAMMDTNVDGVFFATRAALPHLAASDGNLIFVGSFAGQYPRPGNPVYSATKWWVRGFAHGVEGQSGPDGVGVTVVNPTEVRTEFGGADGDSFAERFEPGEVSEPEEIADAIGFAAAQDHSTVHEIDVYRRDKFEGW
ncbi:SDR family NAD(P)-dependent oxidoreductase [Haloplanus salinus]|jgi:NADP-dependent 3-hydroxy acid dehydrogenase YdfG|uniref:SDR family NAD(P)-dependent oxidoreductase n=1 Tax=Haloplanus salinus TaxID=1126245 RepID=A0A368NBQ4_9EURY|nr:SDR family oxidoreductase [Haloplanus salinus]RCU47948.1 SDR family NAD(P)-dependent oxidoreductase [Haloplanus salinus]